MEFDNNVLYLALCGIKGIKPDREYVSTLDCDKLFEECEFHSLTALVCYVLESIGFSDPKWLETKGKAIRKNMLLDLERSKIISFMEKTGIKYMPLKGVFLKEYYPKVGMRQMTDNDIYFDGAYREEIREFMKTLGYQDVFYGSNDDEYKRPPVYNFEMHYALFSDYDSSVFCDYYSDLEKRLVKDDNNSYGYHFSDEDFYVYLITHQYKHYIHCGTGFRSLLDCGVLLEKFSNSYDWDYITEQTQKLGIAEFEEKQRNLWSKLSRDERAQDLTEDEIKILDYLKIGGAHGTYIIGATNSIKNKIGSGKELTFKKKFKYVIMRLFPPMEFYKAGYPFFYRHKYLIPFCFFYRIFKAVFQKNNPAKIEMKVLKDE